VAAIPCSERSTRPGSSVAVIRSASCNESGKGGHGKSLAAPLEAH
jgi:hypothetical protein